jgi:predicted dehydrogenase
MTKHLNRRSGQLKQDAKVHQFVLGFVNDLLTDPATRDVHDVRHRVVAVASSASKQKALDFCSEVKAPSDVKTYGTYHELVANSDVDIIYVATPVSHHFQNAMLALEAGKSVLCEKTFTVTASQARKLISVARAKRLFFMEAVWTRFFPLCTQVRDLVSSGTIGTVRRVIGEPSTIF